METLDWRPPQFYFRIWKNVVEGRVWPDNRCNLPVWKTQACATCNGHTIYTLHYHSFGFPPIVVRIQMCSVLYVIPEEHLSHVGHPNMANSKTYPSGARSSGLLGLGAHQHLVPAVPLLTTIVQWTSRPPLASSNQPQGCDIPVNFN